MLLPCSVFICFETEHIKKEKKYKVFWVALGKMGAILAPQIFIDFKMASTNNHQWKRSFWHACENSNEAGRT